jgi:hypothetical protein
MKFEYIYIDINDNVSKAVERILQSQSENCILFIHEDANVFKNISNLEILLRESKLAGKSIFLNSENEVIKEMAEEIGIPVVEYQGRQVPKRKGPAFVLDIAPPEKISINRNNYINDDYIKEDEEGYSEEDDNDNNDDEYNNNNYNDNNEYDYNNNDLEGIDEKEKENCLIKGRKSFREKWLEYLCNRRMKKLKDKNRKWKMGLLKIVGLIVLIIIVICSSFYFFSKADITIITEKTEFKVQEAIFSSGEVKEVDKENFRIPAKYFEFNKVITETFSATGEKQVEEKSGGIIRIYNNYSSAPQILVATTRFLSSDNKLFRLVKRTTVPGAKLEDGKIVPSYIEAEVLADEAGKEFNIEPDDFSIPGFEGTIREGKFYGKSIESMTGGFIGKAKVVSNSDIVKAKTKIKELAEISAEEEMKVKLETSLEILEDAKRLDVDKLDFSHKLGSRADDFELSADVSLKVLAFSKKDIEDIFSYQSQLSITELNDKEFVESNFDYGVPRVDFNLKQISFPVEANLIFRNKMNIDEFIPEITGMNLRKLKRFFENMEGIKKIEVDISPSFSRIIPYRQENINLIID